MYNIYYDKKRKKYILIIYKKKIFKVCENIETIIEFLDKMNKKNIMSKL